MTTLTTSQLQLVLRRVPDLPDSVCWPWEGYIANTGYGAWSGSRGGKTLHILAHRFMYELHKGPIPAGYEVDHECHNRDLTCIGLGSKCPHRACVNPAHLEAVTGGQNKHNSGRTNFDIQRNKTHCVRNHPFDEGNTYWWREQRHCRTCRTEAEAKRVRV